MNDVEGEGSACLGVSPINVGPRVPHHRLMKDRVGQDHLRCARESLKSE